MEELFNFLIPWAANNNYKIIMPEKSEDDIEIDFININDRTKSIYIGNLGLEKEIYESYGGD